MCMGSHTVIGQSCRQKLSPTALPAPYWAWLIRCSPSAQCYIFIQVEEENPGKQFKKTWKREKEWKPSKLPVGIGKVPEECVHVDVIGLKGAAGLERSPWTEGALWKPNDLWNAGSCQQLNIWCNTLAKHSQGACRGSKSSWKGAGELDGNAWMEMPGWKWLDGKGWMGTSGWEHLDGNELLCRYYRTSWARRRGSSLWGSNIS